MRTSITSVVTSKALFVIVPVFSMFMMGCPPKPPTLDRVRFELEVTDAVSKLVTYQKTPDTDTSSKFHGIAEAGITTAQGVAIVLTIEPQSNAQLPNDLDNEIETHTEDQKIARSIRVYTTDTSNPRRQFTLIADAPGKTVLHVTSDEYDGDIPIPITVTAQTP